MGLLQCFDFGFQTGNVFLAVSYTHLDVYKRQQHDQAVVEQQRVAGLHITGEVFVVEADGVHVTQLLSLIHI